MKSIVDLTYVEYPTADGLYGLILSLISLTPIALFIALFALALVNRDLRYGLLVLGLLLSTIANEVAKKLIKQNRPAFSHKTGYGMPSDHSQFMTFWMVSIITYFTARRVLRGWFFLSFSVCNATLTALVMYSRYYLDVHSVEQVLVGGIIGVVLGYFWTKLIITAETSSAFALARKAIDRIWSRYFVVNSKLA